eukprot:CAMPEP_0173392166 /NCGR_PEP_ID=MMETSP1356-20130122/18799_1 /TAXON_ID=77927 ORGANISM="Hemiselmis virescens, Strain PCC157" /NCGR_SAMPLE_ID=MMETSP1356 /ASSEMBLY_ACC=CAM_ASM_000847 /LENGTH=213 /DNA_ID=CAMNT_0014349899 /DNA_START=145 /DNA_END=786 /DNA_ORIENTATION=+
MTYAIFCDFQIPLLFQGAVLGKGIYLTHQTLWILVTYFGLGFIASVSREILGKRFNALEGFVHWSSPMAGGFGLFLTIMFYALVWPNAGFHENVIKPLEKQGIPMTYYQHVIHSPSIGLVLLECLAKRPELVYAKVEPALAYFKYFVIFGAWYVFVLRYNFSVTGGWPYPFMSEFTAEWQHWVFYTFCFGFIWLLGVVHRSVLLAVTRKPKTK